MGIDKYGYFYFGIGGGGLFGALVSGLGWVMTCPNRSIDPFNRLSLATQLSIVFGVANINCYGTLSGACGGLLGRREIRLRRRHRCSSDKKNSGGKGLGSFRKPRRGRRRLGATERCKRDFKNRANKFRSGRRDVTDRAQIPGST